jgi:hypothetical protein
MELIEKVALAILKDLEPGKCPFKNEPGPLNKVTLADDDEEDDLDGNPEHNKEVSAAENYTVNLSGKLGTSLKNAAGAAHPPAGPYPRTPLKYNSVLLDGPRIGENVGVKPNPHHLIPGHASLPYSSIVMFMSEKDNFPERTKNETAMESEIKNGGGGIDYNVNAAENGMWLPSNNVFRGPWTTPEAQEYQAEYAFLTINRAQAQFHDAHTDYNDYCIGLLNRLCSKITNHIDYAAEHEPCKSNQEGKKFPHAPYPYLKDKLNMISSRLQGYLEIGQIRFWGRPELTTSRFTLAYHEVLKKEKRKEYVYGSGATKFKVTLYSIRAVTGRRKSTART